MSSPTARSKILVHDYAGHPFQIQLSRELARRGHRVLHLYSASTHTPRGPLQPQPDDPATFTVEPVSLSERVAKYSFFRRRRQEIRYGRLLARRVDGYSPDVVISANTPPDAQRRLQDHCIRSGVPFVFWMQDSFGEGVTRVLRRRLPFVGVPVAWYYRGMERRMLRRSDAVVLITDDFLSLLPPPARGRAVTIPNWAPLEQIPVLDRDNVWARSHDLHETRNFIYTGTLGLKHDPRMLLELALAMRDRPEVRIVVVSEGPAARWLESEGTERGLGNLVFRKFQPFEVLPQVMASADVLVALLEKDAGAYAVPSKVLTYLCAGRPLLVAVPKENLAARTVLEAKAGKVVEPGNQTRFVAAARELLEDPEAARAAGMKARRYAERTFDIGAIADRFEGLWAPQD